MIHTQTHIHNHAHWLSQHTNCLASSLLDNRKLFYSAKFLAHNQAQGGGGGVASQLKKFKLQAKRLRQKKKKWQSSCQRPKDQKFESWKKSQVEPMRELQSERFQMKTFM